MKQVYAVNPKTIVVLISSFPYHQLEPGECASDPARHSRGARAGDGHS